MNGPFFQDIVFIACHKQVTHVELPELLEPVSPGLAGVLGNSCMFLEKENWEAPSARRSLSLLQPHIA